MSNYKNLYNYRGVLSKYNLNGFVKESYNPNPIYMTYSDWIKFISNDNKGLLLEGGVKPTFNNVSTINGPVNYNNNSGLAWIN